MPERYRLPLILCHLEGLRHEEVARRLGCAVGTVESRLSRAREQLRLRLIRRGLAPTASVLALAPNPLDSSAAVTVSSMIEPTVQAAITLSSRRRRRPIGHRPWCCPQRLEALPDAPVRRARLDVSGLRRRGRGGTRGLPGRPRTAPSSRNRRRSASEHAPEALRAGSDEDEPGIAAGVGGGLRRTAALRDPSRRR